MINLRIETELILLMKSEEMLRFSRISNILHFKIREAKKLKYNY